MRAFVLKYNGKRVPRLLRNAGEDEPAMGGRGGAGRSDAGVRK